MDIRDIELLRSFAVVAQHGSFTRAADIMGVSQPALTSRIQKLERTLGFPLFARSTRRIDLTREGDRLYHQVQLALAEMDRTFQLAEELDRDRHSVIRVGVVGHSPAYRWKFVDKFREAYPNFSIELEFSPPRVVADRVSKRELDVGFTLQSSLTDRFERLPLYTVPVGFLVRAESRLARSQQLQAADLREETLAICAREMHQEVFEKLSSHISAHGLRYSIAPDARFEGLVDFARRTGMVTVVSPQIGDPKWLPIDLVYRELAGCVPRVEFCLIRRRDSSPKAVAVLFWRIAAVIAREGARPGNAPPLAS